MNTQVRHVRTQFNTHDMEAFDDRGVLRFSVCAAFETTPALCSFGGHFWPGECKELFGHYGPDSYITHRSGPMLNVAGIEAVRNALQTVNA